MEFWQITLISVWSQTWRWPRCSSCSRDSSTPSIFSVKTCAKCWTLGKCQGPSHLPSQEQGRQGPPAFLGQGLTAEMEGWDVRGWGETSGAQARTGVLGMPSGPCSSHWRLSVCTFRQRLMCVQAPSLQLQIRPQKYDRALRSNDMARKLPYAAI